jgi:KUP system potassium uptake protein
MPGAWNADHRRSQGSGRLLEPHRLVETAEIECPIELDTASYFVSTAELRRGAAPTMAPWRKRLFLATSAITADAAEYFNLPRDRTVIVGSQVEV